MSDEFAKACFGTTETPTLKASDATLRDYFAAKAMQGYVSDPDWRSDMGPSDTAFAAYQLADAMLKARGQ